MAVNEYAWYGMHAMLTARTRAHVKREGKSQEKRFPRYEDACKYCRISAIPEQQKMLFALLAEI